MIVGTCDGCDLRCPIVDDVDAYVRSLQAQGLPPGGAAEINAAPLPLQPGVPPLTGAGAGAAATANT